MKYLFWVLVIVGYLGLVKPVLAYAPVNDCVINNFVSDITLQKDSSLSIVEDLDVDCGRLAGKHGIFRILPTKAPERAKGEFADTPIHLNSITDASGRAYNFETIPDTTNHTLTWKIGDPDILISGVNHYRINYTVANTVTERDSKNQLYWNINGNFWQLPTNKLVANIHFPDGVSPDTTNIKIFTGEYGDAESQLADWKWQVTKSDGVTCLALGCPPAPSGYANTLVVTNKAPLPAQQGITLQADFSTGLVSLYQPTFWEKYGVQVQAGVAGGIVLVVFFWALFLWKRRGQELPFAHPVTAEFEPPSNLGPLETLLFSQALAAGDANPGISATIIDLAVRGWIRIEEQKAGMFGLKDWKLVLLKDDVSGLRGYEADVLQGLFGDVLTVNDSVMVSAQRNKFYLTAQKVTKDVKDSFYTKGWLDKTSAKIQTKMILWAVGIIFAVFALPWITVWIIPVGILSAITLFVFGGLMSRRTADGAEVYRLIKGFKLYMSRAEKYRMQFFEKENIFEKYLPYAIAFGLTGLWIKAFKQMYGAEFVNSYIPIWYVGSNIGSGFDLNGFQSQLNTLSSQIGSTLTSSPHSSSSGGGGGFSGGGGGGGGGGSW